MPARLAAAVDPGFALVVHRSTGTRLTIIDCLVGDWNIFAIAACGHWNAPSVMQSATPTSTAGPSLDVVCVVSSHTKVFDANRDGTGMP